MINELTLVIRVKTKQTASCISHCEPKFIGKDWEEKTLEGPHTG